MPSHADRSAAPVSAAAPLAASATSRITVLPQGWTFEAAPGQTLLQAARAAGIRLPSSCRNGTCRACLCRAVTDQGAGSVVYTIEWPGLSAEEIAASWLLPCVAQAQGDLAIEAPGARQVTPPVR